MRKNGIVARYYNVTFPNGYRDFSHALLEVLRLLDNQGCELVFFPRIALSPGAATTPGGTGGPETD